MPATRGLRCISLSTCSHPPVSSTSRLRTFAQARPWSVGTLPPCLTNYTHSSKGSIVSPVDCTPALLLRCHNFLSLAIESMESHVEQRKSMQQAEPEMHNRSDAALYDRYALFTESEKNIERY